VTSAHPILRCFTRRGNMNVDPFADDLATAGPRTYWLPRQAGRATRRILCCSWTRVAVPRHGSTAVRKSGRPMRLERRRGP